MLVHLILDAAAVGKTEHAVSLVRPLAQRGGRARSAAGLPRAQDGRGPVATRAGRGVAYRYLVERRVSERDWPVTEAAASVRVGPDDVAGTGFANGGGSLDVRIEGSDR